MASLTPAGPDPVQDHPQTAAEPPSSPQKAQTRRTTCVYHCDCGRHFASLVAFDLHRPGRTGQRKCVDPATVFTDGKRRLVPKGTDAVCLISHFDKRTADPLPIQGVTVWQTVEAANG